VIIQMAGLPGTGKSTLACALATELSAVVLDKDRVRHALFTTAVAYTRDQDDFCVRLLFEAAAWLLDHGRPTVILDGRTCSQRYQIDQVRQFARRQVQRLLIIECICPETIVRARLAGDDRHPAANRDFALYRRLREAADLIDTPKLTVDTSAVLAHGLTRCLDALSDPTTLAYDPVGRIA
jgi:predicted kinase